VAAVGDSSITEDATNGCGHTTYLGYNDPAWDNGLLIANAVNWLANGTTGGGGSDTTAPTVSVTAPTAGSTVSGTVSINASASDNVGVAKVEFYVDGALRSTDTTSPYSWSWNTTTFADSTHTIVAKAYDAANNMGTSGNVSVTVNNAGGGGTTQLLGNPGFETGVASPWTATAGIIDNSASEAAHSGSWKAWLNGYAAVHTDSLLQSVAIPSTATSATLSFWLHIDTAETGTTAYDTLKVQIRNTSGTVLATLATYSNVNAATGFSQKSFNVLTYKGQTVQVYLVGVEDASLQTSFVVDDFALNVQ
ncbi:MAG TPA: Ig-like domain-containing protein, partial [Thermoanaerobaculia bacterium]|nr:Ig-like domain-containing protein [Thermoanaerobaculia bacterium]